MGGTRSDLEGETPHSRTPKFVSSCSIQPAPAVEPRACVAASERSKFDSLPDDVLGRSARHVLTRPVSRDQPGTFNGQFRSLRVTLLLDTHRTTIVSRVLAGDVPLPVGRDCGCLAQPLLPEDRVCRWCAELPDLGGTRTGGLFSQEPDAGVHRVGAIHTH
jgi:hypothetical protein